MAIMDRLTAPITSPTAANEQLRWPAAAAAVVAGAAHIPVIGPHLSETPYIGWLFVALTAACFALALALVVPRLDIVALWTMAGATGVSAAVGFALSRGPGLPGMSDDIGDWSNRLGLISVASESLLAALALTALHNYRRRPDRMLAAAGLLIVLMYGLGLTTT